MKVLTFTRNFPSAALPRLGLWVEELVRATAKLVEQKVVAPIPYAPPLPKLPEAYARFRLVPRFKGDKRF